MQNFLAPLSLTGVEIVECGASRRVIESSVALVNVSRACGVVTSEWLSKSFQAPFL